MVVDRVVVATGYRVEPELATALSSPFPIRAPKITTSIAPRPWMASGLTQAAGPVPRMALEREWHLAASEKPVAGGVWVIGDARSGPATVVAAMAQGLAAARAIMHVPQPSSDTADGPTRDGRRRAVPASGLNVVGRRDRPAASAAPRRTPAPRLESEGTLFPGLGLLGFGLVSCLTIVGLPLGVPMVVIGLLLVGIDALLAIGTRRRAARAAARPKLARVGGWAVPRSGPPVGGVDTAR
jgi:hypothetical protein